MKISIYTKLICIVLIASAYSCKIIKIPEKQLFIGARYDNYLKALEKKDNAHKENASLS